MDGLFPAGFFPPFVTPVDLRRVLGEGAAGAAAAARLRCTGLAAGTLRAILGTIVELRKSRGRDEKRAALLVVGYFYRHGQLRFRPCN